MFWKGWKSHVFLVKRMPITDFLVKKDHFWVEERGRNGPSGKLDLMDELDFLDKLDP